MAAIRNKNTGGARKRIAGETAKGATPKKKGSAPKVSTMDRARMIAEHARIRQSVSKTKTNISPEPETTSPKTKANPDEQRTTTYKLPVSKPAAKPAPGQNVVKTPVTKAQRPNSGTISKPAVKAPVRKLTK
jgi:hypothetical protein